MKKITITEIAEEAGVSIGTVSLVMNKKGKVAAKTRKRVESIIKKYDYHPSRMARNLASRSNNLIGLIIAENHFNSDEYFYTKIVVSSMVQADRLNKHLMLSLVKKEGSQKPSTIPLPQFVMDRSVDGVIAMGDFPLQYLERIIQRKLPMVLVDFSCPALSSVSTIMANNFMGGYNATRHLLKLGHKKVACIADMADHPSIEERVRGYKKALEDYQVNQNDNRICMDKLYSPYQYGFFIGEKIADGKVDATAVFAANDSMAIGCMHALQNKNLKIPKDVAIVGCDDIAASSQIIPKLTTIRIPRKQMGEVAVEKILKLVGNKEEIPEMVILPVDLIVRDSCGSPDKTVEKIHLV